MIRILGRPEGRLARDRAGTSPLARGLSYLASGLSRPRFAPALAFAFAFAVAFALALGAAGCHRSFEIAVGPNEDIEIFSDLPSGDRRIEALARFFERKVETPIRPERLFSVTVAGSGSFQSMRRYRNLVVIGDLASPGWSRDLCTRVLGEAGCASVAGAEPAYVFTRDVWARGQTLLFVHAPDEERFAELLEQRGEEIIAQFTQRVIDGLGQTIFELAGEQTALTDGISRRHGYQLRIPGDYLVDEAPQSRFVRIKRIQPDEPVTFLFVYYEPRRMELDDPRLPTLCMALRDTLGGRYFGGDWVDPTRTKASRTTFLGRPALEIYGLYQNDAPMGGPFRMYCFHEGDRLYLIDLAVYNPPGRKLPYLRQLEAIARTFETEQERLGRRSPGA